MVAGMHPHVAQGTEIYKSKHIFYSLGNAVFNMAWQPTKYGLMINVDLSGYKPIVTSRYIKVGQDCFPEFVENVPRPYSLEYLNPLIDKTTENEIYFDHVKKSYHKYRHSNRKWVLGNIIKMSNSSRKKIIKDFINRRFK